MSLVWANGAMRRLEEEMRCASMTDASVMLTGESGVGKRFAANMIHQLSQRRRAPFVAINAADVLSATPPAGVGATVAVGGAFLQAPDDGTLAHSGHREDAGDGPVTVTGIHGSIDNRQETRAAHDGHTAHLFRLVQAGLFRDDLFYRLNVIHFTIPPLRERREDIPLMFRHYLSLHARTEAPRLSSAARRRLIEYAWPGNIRELRTVTQQLSARRYPTSSSRSTCPARLASDHWVFRELLPNAI